MLTLADIDREIHNIVEHGTSRQDVACLADLYVCREAMQNEGKQDRIEADGSEFAACINGKCFSEILPFLEELLETLKILQPKLYEAFLNKIR